MKKTIWIYSIAIFFIIGFLCLLFGCSPTNSDFCMVYNKNQGTIYDYNVYKHTCKGKCKEKKSRHCKKYSYYNCYDMTIYVKYEENNHVYECRKKIQDDYKLEYLNNSVEKYKINKKINIYNLKNKHLPVCNLHEDMIINWWVGISFLIVTSLIVICFVYCSCTSEKKYDVIKNTNIVNIDIVNANVENVA